MLFLYYFCALVMNFLFILRRFSRLCCCRLYVEIRSFMLANFLALQVSPYVGWVSFVYLHVDGVTALLYNVNFTLLISHFDSLWLFSISLLLCFMWLRISLCALRSIHCMCIPQSWFVCNHKDILWMWAWWFLWTGWW